MKFQNLTEANEKYFPYSPTNVARPDYEMSGDWLKMGEWALFQHLHGDTMLNQTTISKPILALIVGHTVWDMATVLEYVEEWRAWHCNAELLNPHVNEYYPIASDDKEVKHIQFWTDDILILGKWNHKPTWKEIRVAYKNSK